MDTTLRRTALSLAASAAIALAGASLASPPTHAQPNGSGSGSSSGRGCSTSSGGTMEDGEIRTFRTKHMRGSTTCTDGTRCESWSTRQGDGTWRHFSECTDAAGVVFAKAPSVPAGPGPTLAVGR